MSQANWFWILYVVFFLFSGFLSWPFAQNSRSLGLTVIFFVLIGLLGYHDFGSVVK